MAQGKKHNKKLPKDAVSNTDIDPKYGYVHGEWDVCGGHHWVYRNPEESDKTFSQVLRPSGNYQTIEQDSEKKEIVTNLHPGEYRQYHGGGRSIHADGHIDVNTESTHRVESAGDMASATPQNKLLGVGGKRITLAQDESHFNPEGSDAVMSRGYGTVRTSIKKNDYKHVEGDRSTMGEKNCVEVYKKDRGMYSENLDMFASANVKMESKKAFNIETGSTATVNSESKVIVNSKSDAVVNSQAKVIITASSSANISAQEITITADTKITLKVGSNKIEISSSGITIDAGGGKVDITASGIVKTKGAATKVQGGGLPSPPVTFT